MWILHATASFLNKSVTETGFYEVHPASMARGDDSMRAGQASQTAVKVLNRQNEHSWPKAVDGGEPCHRKA